MEIISQLNCDGTDSFMDGRVLMLPTNQLGMSRLYINKRTNGEVKRRKISLVNFQVLKSSCICVPPPIVERST